MPGELCLSHRLTSRSFYSKQRVQGGISQTVATGKTITWLIIASIGVIVLLLFLYAPLWGETMATVEIKLPDTLAGWKLKGPAKRVDRENIFDYMNGAGELYLSYHFDHLVVYEYQDRGKNEILVEIYHMKDTKDAFGLLSIDWGGEVIKLQPEKRPANPFPAALYGKGLLRIWWGNLYIRIMAVKETLEVRTTIIQLARIIIKDRHPGEPPPFLSLLPPSLELKGSQWRLNLQRISYFSSHLVLNSLYYLSHDNILNLDHSCEALFAPYQLKSTTRAVVRSPLLMIRYTDKQKARKGLHRFIKSYIPEHQQEQNNKGRSESRGRVKVEDGWLGYLLAGRHLVVIFTHPGAESLKAMLDQVALNTFLQED
jgi:hypothetical protein